ncbi:hypothetical protein Alsa3_CDS0145 [Staphylococcus phage Alsa_3]|nr:hypothetical protein Alsa3_CDS0145 [Staphylococcus phage Alsa_3]WNM51270.1 hypothetical protein Alsa4_CDS0140 [Staphylococcus phage Alsa_4]
MYHIAWVSVAVVINSVSCNFFVSYCYCFCVSVIFFIIKSILFF